MKKFLILALSALIPLSAISQGGFPIRLKTDSGTVIVISPAQMTRANVAHEKAVQYKMEVDSCLDDMALAVSLIKVMNERNKIIEQDVGLLTQINVKQGMQITELQAHNKKLDKKNKWLQIKALLFLIAGSSLVLLN